MTRIATFMFLVLTGIGVISTPARADHLGQNILHLDEVLTALDFGPNRREELLRGETIRKTDPMLRGSEISGITLTLVRAPIIDVYAAIRDARLTTAGRTISQDMGDKLEDPPAPSAPPPPGVELPSLATAAIDSAFLGLPALRVNLGDEEITAIKAAGQDEALAVSTYHAALNQRMVSYLKKGMTAITPYARPDRAVRPRDLLSRMSAQAPLMRGRAPQFFRALLNFPRDTGDGVEHEFGWLQEEVMDEQPVILWHRLQHSTEHYGFIAERHIYVSHAYRVMQVLIGCVPVEEGTALFCINRLALDAPARQPSANLEPGLIMTGKRMRAIATRFDAISRTVEATAVMPPKTDAVKTETESSKP